jgi:hypothetical protein
VVALYGLSAHAPQVRREMMGGAWLANLIERTSDGRDRPRCDQARRQDRGAAVGLPAEARWGAAVVLRHGLLRPAATQPAANLDVGAIWSRRLWGALLDGIG